MKWKRVITVCLLCCSCLGWARVSAQTVREQMPLELILSNDTSDILKDVYIGKPRICLYGGGKRIKVRVRNEGLEVVKKVHLIMYYQGHRIFKSRLPVLHSQAEYGFAVNVKVDDELDLSQLEFKLYKKKIYRVYRPLND